MAQWDHGYVTDVAYTTNAYQEAAPSWLAACAVLLGHRPADLLAPFRYADLGCGNGLSALIAAANHPFAEVWGFDFNPTHIENARALAAWAGLSNVHFEEMSFEALANGEGASGGDFDFVVTHGVLSWISLENRRHLANAIGRKLRPGGLAYISYNGAAGWAGMDPIRLLMRQLAEKDQRRTDQTATEIFRVLDQLRTGGAAFFRAHPGLEARIEQMKAQDPRYLAHEFLNKDWYPVMFAEVADVMAETKTRYIGSATLMENLDAVSLPEAVLPVLNAIHDTATRETIRDLASAKSFRRDLWRKGGEPLPGQEHIALIDRLTLLWTGKTVEAEITFAGPIGSVTGQGEFYRPILDAVVAGPVTVGQLRAIPALQGRQVGEFVQAAILLLGGGYAHPAWPELGRPEIRESAKRLNLAIVGRVRMGVDLFRLASPITGSSVAVDVIEALVVGRLLEGSPYDAEPLTDMVLNDVLHSGRSLMREGKPLRDVADMRVVVGDTVRGFLTRRVQLLRLMGVID